MLCRVRIAVALGVMTAAVALADSHVRIVRISYLNQGVEVKRPVPDGGSNRWTAGMLNAPVIEGEQIRTAASGSAEVQLECGSALRLTPDTDLTASVLLLGSDGVRKSKFQLTSGTLYASIVSADARDFQLTVPDGTISTPDGKVALRVEVPVGAPSNVELLDGHAAVTVGQRTWKLVKHSRLRLGPGATVTQITEAKADRWSRWSRNRDQTFQRALNAQFPTTLIDATSSALPVLQPAVSPPPTDTSSVFDTVVLPPLQPGPTAAAKLGRVPSCGR